MTVEVWWSTLAAADHELTALLDDTERARLDSFDRPADRGRSLVGAALLRLAVAAHLGVGAAEVVLDRTCAECGRPHGAPRVLGAGDRRPGVSVAHSGVLVVVALDPHGPVGVDVQRASDLPDPGAVGDWVRREAAVKARTWTDLGGASPAALVTSDLRPPVGGYAAALTTVGERTVRHVDRTQGLRSARGR
ncbi:hypothetical protein Q6350_09810 [Isoptericola sp. b515]|uniref:4'-phosphopantetheinyl transferase family protein n=1 Tax=Isoptericola sp. b515 TaxID=3064652 RepID=UPI0027141F24|nr:hypothetical protein [Isoptericola sp. b515]MDO8148730.1 hypothetical protein [Isoptericola sp. b515]